MNDAYQHLDPRVKKWVYKQGWPDLREIQKKAIPAILPADRDVLISASTAAGKTEAFFLPACSAIEDNAQGFSILYVSPLKALINDQNRRLESLCDMLDMRVTPWHGDTLQSKKKRAKADPSGILLITPESLESLLVRESAWVKQSFSSLKYIVIDEFHAFIGSERGHHLLSLLNRIEHLLNRYDSPIPRVALSATLGNLEEVPLSLRPNQSLPCEKITDDKSQSTLKIKVKGYIELHKKKSKDQPSIEHKVCEDIYKFCRGGSHLVFANSRKRTESIAAQLSDFCENEMVPNEFFPHHGSLAKELREELESRLQKETLPTTAICTMTLELGIDIGKVNSVIQVTAPHSVSSLRQRMGRSGRRNTPSVLRNLITENELTISSGMVDKLRMELVQSIAMIRLLVGSKWFEPADTKQKHFSTFLHQVLAVTAQWGGIRPDQIYTLLCKNGPFNKISIPHFKTLLTHMGEIELLTQLSSGELVLGQQGEFLVSHYSFYAVFKTPEEYRVLNAGKPLGTLPIDSLIMEGQHIVFGGRRWKVTEVDTDKKVIYVEATKGGNPPKFGGGSLSIHDKIREEMYRVYSEKDYRIDVGGAKVDFIDSTARELFDEGVRFFHDQKLHSESIVQAGNNVSIFTWKGDKIVNTLSAILAQQGYTAGAFAGVIEVSNTSTESVIACLKNVLSHGVPTEVELALSTPEVLTEKFDEYLPPQLLAEGYGVKVFDSSAAESWMMKALSA